MISLPAFVPTAHQIDVVTEDLMKRTDPSIINRLTPPECRLMAVLATPVLTPNGLASQLGISPQAATRLLAMLTTANVVREVTGRKSFRAFAV